MQEIINAVVIDDNEKELLEVTKALALKAISTIPIHYTDPSSTYQKCEKSSEAVPRIIITDIQMHSSGPSPNSDDFAHVAKCIINIISHTEGPYAILAWSSVSQSFAKLKKYVEKALLLRKQRPPIFFGSIDKSECKVEGTDIYDADKVLKKFSSALNQHKQLKALMNWEKLVFSAAHSSVNAVAKHGIDNSLEHTIGCLASEVAGKNLKGNEAAAVNEVLSYVLNDKIEHNSRSTNKIWKDALAGYDQRKKLDNGIKHQINGSLHFDFKIDKECICPGQLWLVKNEQLFFEQLFYKKQISKMTAELKKELFKSSEVTNHQFIALEVTPSCDFAQNNKLAHSIVLGGLIKTETLSNSQKNHIKNKSNIYSIDIRFQNIDYTLVISLNYISACSTNKIKHWEKSIFSSGQVLERVFRMRQNMLHSIVHQLATHNSRIGTVSF